MVKKNAIVTLVLCLVLFISLFRHFTGVASDVDVPNQADYDWILFEGVPEDLIPEQMESLYGVVVDQEEETFEFYLVGMTYDYSALVLDKVTLGIMYNAAKGGVSFEDGKIHLFSQMPFSAQEVHVEISWDGKKLQLIREWDYDPSMESLSRVEDLLKQGDVTTALEELEGIMYPHQYYDDKEMAVLFLKAAHEHGLKAFREGNLKKAIQLYCEARQVFGGDELAVFESKAAYEESEFSPFLSWEDYLSAINDYGFFLEQADENAEAVDVLTRVIRFDPTRMVAYLNLADAQWKNGDKEEAARNYTEYIRCMEDKGLTKKIPSRALERRSPTRVVKILPALKGIDTSKVQYVFSETVPDPKLEKAILFTLGIKRGEETRYYYNRIDLNGDGKKEVFVLLAGPKVCGSGGCLGALFRPIGTEYQLFNQFTLINNPVVVSSNKTNGWNDLIMFVSGGGANGYYVCMKNNGGRYSSNPSIQPKLPAASKIAGQAIIADDISVYRGLVL